MPLVDAYRAGRLVAGGLSWRELTEFTNDYFMAQTVERWAIWAKMKVCVCILFNLHILICTYTTGLTNVNYPVG